MDRVVTVSHQSYGSRITGSCGGMILSPILLILGTWLLVWNEGNSIMQHKSLEEGLKAVIDVSADSVDSANEGRLVHFIGKATAANEISDPIFGVTPADALVLKRSVEMYQWVESESSETTKNTGGSTTTVTTYSYSKQWRGDLVYSDWFQELNGHENPTSMKFSSQMVVANPAYAGAFELPSEVMQKMMNWYKPLSSSVSRDTILDETTKSEALVYNNGFYFGDDPSLPEVGDTRVSFMEVPEQTISIVAKQSQSSLAAYQTSYGASILLVEAGTHDAPEMFLHANQDVTAMTWLIRFVGFFLIWIALNALVAPLAVMADCFPFLGDLVGAVQGCVTFFVAGAFSTLVIGIAWFAYRPLFSIGLFIIVGGGAFAIRKYAGTGKGAGAQRAEEYEIPSSQFKDDSFA